jgi:hypothetical protein
MAWNVFHKYMTMSDCHSFGSREGAVQYACALINSGTEAHGIAVGTKDQGGHEIRLIHADLI